MKFLDAVWARLTTTASGAANPGPASPVPSNSTPGAQNPLAQAPRAGIEGLAVRCATALPAGVFADRHRVKWVLLQPEVAAAALRFASLAALGRKRADEAREAREALRALLVTELPSEWPEHIEMLLDSIQAEARGVPATATDGPPAAADAVEGRRGRDWAAELPEVRNPALAPSGLPLLPAGAPFQLAYADQASNRPVPGEWPAAGPQTGAGSLTPTEYELHTLPGTSVDDVNVELVREYVQGSTRRRASSPLSAIGVPDVLRALKAIDGPVGRERLTVLGGLFFGQQPGRLVVQSKIRFVEFPGVDVASTGETVAYRYSEEVTGTIPDLIARMERLHKERLAPGVLADGFRVEELPSVPLFALREAIVNAVCHRDYSLVGANIQVRLFSDRLEVQSPGGLPGPVTVDNILTESYARNPRVADILRDLGYVERHGLGIDNMFASMDDAHLPPPEFNNSATSFTVTLRFRPPDEVDPEEWLADIGAVTLDYGHQKALVFARRMGRIVATDYMAFSFVEEAEAESQLRGLVRKGWLVQNGTGDKAFYALGPSADPTAHAEHGDNPLPPDVLDSLSGPQRRIFDIVARQGKAKASEVLEISALKDRRTIQRALATLAQRGLIVRHASSRTDPNATYEVNGDFRDDAPTNQSK